MIAPQPLDTKYTCIEMDLQTLTGYFNAAVCGHEKIAPLKRLWEQQLGIIRASHSATTTGVEQVLDFIYGELQAAQTEAEGIEVITWSDVQAIFDILRAQRQQEKRGA